VPGILELPFFVKKTDSLQASQTENIFPIKIITYLHAATRQYNKKDI
jgi:hypothetical protein